ncbi:MAG: amidohydrolase, partial [Acidobacteriia bacterium]|nr:amidohydrolase [Terriglobia bacterium]
MKLAALVLLSLPALYAQADPSLLSFYKGLHQHPELSGHEERTAALLASELRNAGYTVTEHVGKYADGATAAGVVAILKNGPGPTLLLRTETDALPVEEQPGLPYASQHSGVMHACGHDLHMTALLGTARELARRKDRWSGTLLFIAQPAEETIGGAKAMLADNLYGRFGKPDYAIALHDDPYIEAGKVGVISGPLLASATSVDV